MHDCLGVGAGPVRDHSGADQELAAVISLLRCEFQSQPSRRAGLDDAELLSWWAHAGIAGEAPHRYESVSALRASCKAYAASTVAGRRVPVPAEIDRVTVMARRLPAPEYSRPVAMRNSTGWSTGARKSRGTSSLRVRGITMITLGVFALIAAGTASQVSRAALAAAALTLIGVVVSLAGWCMLVVARRREHSSD
jgi:hypothetical protein